jgi:hypothetical protein
MRQREVTLLQNVFLGFLEKEKWRGGGLLVKCEEEERMSGYLLLVQVLRTHEKREVATVAVAVAEPRARV